MSTIKFNPKLIVKDSKYIIQYVEPILVKDIESTFKEITSAKDVFTLLSELQDSSKEKFLAIHLNTRNRVLCIEVVHIGSTNSSLVSPDSVLRTSLLVNAKALVIAHNHPSGEITPSPEDKKITQVLKNACLIFSIGLLDHVIIGDNKYYSFAENNLI